MIPSPSGIGRQDHDVTNPSGKHSFERNPLPEWYCWMDGRLYADHGYDIGYQDFRSADWFWERDLVSSGKFRNEITNSSYELRDHQETLIEGEIVLSNDENRKLATLGELGECAKCRVHASTFLFYLMGTAAILPTPTFLESFILVRGTRQ
jgi:hypothetical protein